MRLQVEGGQGWRGNGISLCLQTPSSMPRRSKVKGCTAAAVLSACGDFRHRLWSVKVY